MAWHGVNEVKSGIFTALIQAESLLKKLVRGGTI